MCERALVGKKAKEKKPWGFQLSCDDPSCTKQNGQASGFYCAPLSLSASAGPHAVACVSLEKLTSRTYTRALVVVVVHQTRPVPWIYLACFDGWRKRRRGVRVSVRSFPRRRRRADTVKRFFFLFSLLLKFLFSSIIIIIERIRFLLFIQSFRRTPCVGGEGSYTQHIIFITTTKTLYKITSFYRLGVFLCNSYTRVPFEPTALLEFEGIFKIFSVTPPVVINERRR